MIDYQMKHFYDQSDNVLGAFASDLGLKPGQWPIEFTISNPETGNSVKFADGISVEDAEGELRYYAYTSKDSGLNHNIKNLIVKIFND
jgi:hypothetical protein